ncbi:hypothetical protein T492DRAFT_628716 [Pavlovales sp. CCMP2436]|nr:hypothetical protein T492DRAFT_628716 [Pavlovales sp. CCMP2436]
MKRCTLILGLIPGLVVSTHAAISRQGVSAVAGAARANPRMVATQGASVFTRSVATADRAALKQQILQLGAALDRGQSFNPTSGDYYESSINAAKERVDALIALASPPPTSLEELDGEWELVFFKLHELQTCSWGASKIGRVAQRIDAKAGMLYSEFDTSIFSLTVIPVLGWFKLLPTFGGCVVTASSAKIDPERPGVIKMVVEYTTGQKVPGLMGLGEWIWGVKVPVRGIWKLLPWNKGRDPECEVEIVYLDDDFRIARDIDGDCFVYTRPVVSRS